MENHLLIVSRSAEKYAQLIRQARLPSLNILPFESSVMTGEDFKSANIILGEPNLIRDILPELPSLKWVQSTWAGVETLLGPGLRQDYHLTNVRGVFGRLMTEYVIGYLLFIERLMLQKIQAQQISRWDNTPPGTLYGKTLGLLGVGSIGSEIAKTAHHFGMNVLGFTLGSESSQYVDRYFHPPYENEFASLVDYLVVVLPITKKTYHLVDKDFLGSLPGGAILINVGRGSLIDDQALITSAKSGHLKACILDVFQEEPLSEGHPFWKIPNLFITYHTAALSYPEDIAPVFIKNYLLFFNDQPLLNNVNFLKGY